MIFVTGCARSGTSLITKILAAHGCNLGEPVNVLYENTAIRQNVLKPYLVRCGADPMGQSKLPDTDNLPAFPDLRERVLAHIKGEGPKAYKDAKLTLVWPEFDRAFPEAQWVLVRRSKERIVDSCLRPKTSEGFGRFMLAADDRAYWEQWVEEHERRFCRMRHRLYLTEVWPDLIVRDPSAFVAVAAYLGLEFDLEKTVECIDRKLWHGH